MASGDIALPSLKYLLAESSRTTSKFINLRALVCAPDKACGRGLKLKAPSPKRILEDWRELNRSNGSDTDIAVFQPDTLRLSQDNAERKDFENFLAKSPPDILLVMAYGKLIPRRILQAATLAPINLHASLLPRWRGASPIHHALLAGDKISGVSVMRVVAEMDAGEVFASLKLEIDEKMTGGELHDALAILARDALADFLCNIAKTDKLPVAKTQDESKVTYAGKLSRKDGEIDWRKDASEICRQIRAFHPWPSSVAFLQKKSAKRSKKERLKILPPTRAHSEDEFDNLVNDTRTQQKLAKLIVGEFLFSDDGKLLIRCGKGCLEVGRLQFAGGKVLNEDEFRHGLQNVSKGKFI